MTIQQLLLKYWGHSNFRPLQEEIISSILEGKDTLALLPTGGGKSLCFQLPALSKDGICLVISPLIALMKDQVDNLKKKGIKAMAISSGMTKNEIDIAFDNCIHGNYKFLYLSPERLETELARIRIQKMNVNLIAVDEAHCISQWGYDFRPSYLKIAELRDLLPTVPLLALTATAVPEVAKDIRSKLLFKNENIFTGSFERKNLSYIVKRDEDKFGRLLKIVKKLNGSGIVYVKNRRKTQEIVSFLQNNSISSDYYHAGLTTDQRNSKQEQWINNKTRVIVCTNAFGMGIDKPDVRFVVHIDLPDCLESYFQESGRAGRDEKKSYAILLFSDSDKTEAINHLQLSFPPLDDIKKVYQALANYLQIPIGAGVGSSFDFKISVFCSQYSLTPITTYNSLKFLEKEGYLVLSDGFFHPSRIIFRLNKEQLYKFQVEHSKYDDFIKLILRSYTGVFDNYTRISEEDLSRRSGKRVEDVKKNLTDLHKMDVLTFYPQSETAQILFSSERIDASHIYISPETLTVRKKKATERMNSMIYYCESKTKCRSQILLSYFGESDSYRCGTCDICIERNKLELSSLEFDNISLQIKEETLTHPKSLEEIVFFVKNSTEDKTLKVIRWLIDTGKLVQLDSILYSWKK